LMNGRRLGIVAAMIEKLSSVWVHTMNLSWRNVGLVVKPTVLKLARRKAITMIKLSALLVSEMDWV